MKKVKVALTAVAVFAVVGGALAFKANRLNQKVYLHDPNDTRPSACTLLSTKATTFISQKFITRTLASTTTTTSGCPIVDVYEGQ